MPDTVARSRAVKRKIEPSTSGSPQAFCDYCGLVIKFRARHKEYTVICNVYVDGKWDRVEHFHEACYDEAERPHGEARDGTD